MRIAKQLQFPSRPDAVRLRRNEKFAMMHMMYAVTTLEDLQKDLADRLGMVENGMERMKSAASFTDDLLTDLRVTVPKDQRESMQHTGEDYEMRLAPKMTPCKNNVVMTADEFRELVDAAREKCRECVMDDNECEECKLYRLLTCVLPMDDYHEINLCPYNIGEWKN